MAKQFLGNPKFGPDFFYGDVCCNRSSDSIINFKINGYGRAFKSTYRPRNCSLCIHLDLHS